MLKISKDLFDLLYPIGTYYETSNANWTPSSAGWYGTWVEDTAGKTTVAKDTGTFKTLGASVGSESKTTKNHTLTVDEMPTHNHIPNIAANANAGGLNAGYGIDYYSGQRYPVKDANNPTGGEFTGWGTQNSGGNKAHNHGDINVIQPSVVVRRWHRTA